MSFYILLFLTPLLQASAERDLLSRQAQPQLPQPFPPVQEEETHEPPEDGDYDYKKGRTSSCLWNCSISQKFSPCISPVILTTKLLTNIDV